MKVFVVHVHEEGGGCESCYYSRYVVEGVFSTEKDAKEWVRRFGSPFSCDITEHEIDGRVPELTR